MRPITFFAAALAALVMGCGHASVKDVCDDLSDKCGTVPHDDCTMDGNVLEARAKQKGCEDAFNTYIDCVSDQVCSFREACVTERADLEKCGGAFP